MQIRAEADEYAALREAEADALETGKRVTTYSRMKESADRLDHYFECRGESYARLYLRQLATCLRTHPIHLHQLREIGDLQACPTSLV